MALESLLELVKTLSKRIEEHGEDLRKNEALTRTALIDPLLRELGWNIEDPAQVIPEYVLRTGKPDYVLLRDGKPMIVVEAKNLGKRLEAAADQAIGYFLHDGISYFSVTNGKEWEIYERNKQTRRDEGPNRNLIVQFDQVVWFDITESPAKVCLKALALWRPGVEAGGVSPAQPSIVEHRPSTTASAPDSQDPVPPSPAPDTDSAWIPYSRFHQTENLYSKFHQTGKKIRVELQFPDGKRVQIQNGYEVATETVQWLFEKGHLKPDRPDHCPIQRGSRYILATESEHPSGEKFKEDKPIGPFHIETNYSTEYNIKNACKVIERTGQEPAQFKIKSSS